MNLFKTIGENDTMLDLMNNVITNIKFYINHREELNDIKITNDELFLYIAKMEEVKSRYYTNKVPNWFKEFKASLLLSGSFPYINSYLGFTFSLYDMVNMVLCEDMKFNFSNELILEIETTKLIDVQNVMIYFKDGSSTIYDKDDWDKNFKNFY